GPLVSLLQCANHRPDHQAKLNQNTPMSTPRRVVVVAGQSLSHLISMLEFAAMCLRRGLAVTVAVPDPSLTAPAFRSTIGRGTDLYATVLDVFGRIAGARGILVNTFDALEGSAVSALRDGRCLRGRATPPVYCVGPLIAEGEEEEERHPCLPWLDVQPERSVVFLCFGSRCTVSLQQIGEMAKGLEKSGHRFLWVLRAPPAFAAAGGGPDAALSLLPEGFLARTADRGFVVTASWVPQVEVLRHSSTGAFVTHCGWNSTLEAVVAGVPMVCWPLVAEQWMNKVYIVQDMKVGVEVRGYKRGGLVRADDVDAAVRQIMDMEPERRRALEERIMAVKKSAQAVWKEDGSSCTAFTEFMMQTE
uniref:Uncharacterized protein n=1 Tax=Aegilops tauschii subsp. strangulata TaxID=200361 RepID=A0A453S922_AEGTS